MSGDLRPINDLSLGQAAATYAQMGWHVLPVWWVNSDGVCACELGERCPSPGKHPLIKAWQHEATTDLTRISDWWTQHPNANVGINCRASGFLALDVDQGKVLPADWPAFANGTPAPETLMQRSGNASPAHHVLYSTAALPEGWTIRGKVKAPGVPGVDKILIRHNGLIVVAPSMHASGRRYAWISPGVPVDPGPVIWPLVAYERKAGEDGEANGAGGGIRLARVSYSDLVQKSVDDASAGLSRSTAGFELGLQLRDNGCSRLDAERVWLPIFWRQTYEMEGRGPGPDQGIIGRWAESVYSQPPREPLAAYDPAVIELQATMRAQQAAAAATPTETPIESSAPILVSVTDLDVEQAMDPIESTDLGNSRRLVRLLSGNSLYVADRRTWMCWDGQRWVEDIGEVAVYGRIPDVIHEIQIEALSAPDAKSAARLVEWSKISQSESKQRAMVAGAARHSEMVVTSDQFDLDPELLVVRNGTIDLRTGALRAGLPSDLNSKMAGVSFDPEAVCPRWRDHVRFLVQGDGVIGEHLWKAIGYSLTGLVSERAFFFLEGDGANGKSAFVEAVLRLLGDYATVSNERLLVESNEHPAILADLVGRRFVFVDEPRAGRKLHVERIKMLTGGDRIKARFMGQNWFDFGMQAKIWIAGNGRPAIMDPSDGIWSRLHEIRCTGKVGQGVPMIKDYGELLFEHEGAGILNWALGGFLAWRAEHLVKPAGVAITVAEHRDEDDTFIQFAEQCLVRVAMTEDNWLSVAGVQEEYQRWCDAQRFYDVDRRLSNARLGARIRKWLGHESVVRRIGSRTPRVWYGLAWGPEASEVARLSSGVA